MPSSEMELLKASALPFTRVDEVRDKLGSYLDSYGDCKVLLLGDASHGTSEFYTVRAEITKYMIENHGFNIVAVEADWPDAEAVDRYVRRRQPGPGSRDSVKPGTNSEEYRKNAAFSRFPTWMWRNMETHDFVKWLHKYNNGLGETEATGFYGLDLYSMLTSMQSVIKYLEKIDKEMAKIARERYENLMIWGEDPQDYGLEILMTKFKGYENEVVAMLRDLLKKRVEYSAAWWDGMEFHSGEQNARVAVDAEKYYKTMYHGKDESWNLRDTHMFQTLVRILKHRGGSSKAIVWAHNSHIGDARATDMGQSREEVNVGQLCKETFGDRALSIGMGTFTGTVAAATRWDGDMKVMKVQPGLPDSCEELMHSTGIKNFALDMRLGVCEPKLLKFLRREHIQRFIGVLYRPSTERQSHYSRVILPEQFDGYIWMDETRHVSAFEIHQPQDVSEYSETWPFGY